MSESSSDALWRPNSDHMSILPPGDNGGTFVPTESETLEDTGLSYETVADLLLKGFYSAGTTDGLTMSKAVKLPWHIVRDVLTGLKRNKCCEIVSGGGVMDHSFRYAITSRGIERAREALARNQYSGPAPVSLETYVEYLSQQVSTFPAVSREAVSQSLKGLVIESDLIDRIAAAINSHRSVMLHGATGNGKTTVAQSMGEMLGGNLFVPYAVEVDHQIVQVFDPKYHVQALDSAQAPSLFGLARRPRLDARWVMIRRPLLVAGTELTLDHFELSYDPEFRVYQAPIQMKANGGVLLVDDFGRQQVQPRDLLNRLIYPLENEADFLTLISGQALRIPFALLLVLATNLDPADLLDEAFIRRIRHKIAFPDPTPEQFAEIMRRECARREVVFDPGVVDYLLAEKYGKHQRPLRACHPRDLVAIIVDIARVDGSQPRLTRQSIDRAADAYFV